MPYRQPEGAVKSIGRWQLLQLSLGGALSDGNPLGSVGDVQDVAAAANTSAGVHLVPNACVVLRGLGCGVEVWWAVGGGGGGDGRC